MDVDLEKDDGNGEAQRGDASRDGCELAVLARRWAALVRFRAASHQLPHGFFHRYTALAESLIRKQRRPLGPPFAIFGRGDDNAADVEAGFWVDGPTAGFDDVLPKELPETLVATSVHSGPYERIGESYAALLGWMDERRLGRAGAFMEIYLNGLDRSDPQRTRTRLIVPVHARARS
jgi:effector-binding domain-containing protein